MKKRILIFPFNLLAHYTRTIVLADSFEKRHDILFADGSYAHLVKANGYKTFRFTGLDSAKAMRGAENFDFRWLNLNDLEHVLEQQVGIITDLKPDLVIGDTSHTLKIAAELCKIRYVSLMNTYMSKYYSCTRRLPPVHPAYRYQQKIPSKYFDPVIRIAEKFAFRQVHKPFRVIRRKLGLIETRNLLDEMEGDENILCDHPLIFPHKHLPPNYFMAGPLLYQKGPAAVCDDLTRPIIYVSMGSSGDWDSMKFLSAVEYSKFNIVTSGDAKQVLTGDHIRSYGFIDPGNILSKAKLVICHGGNGTLYQALKYKVPVLARPANFEQYYNLDGLIRCEAGEELDLSNQQNTMSQIDRWISKKAEPEFQARMNFISSEPNNSLSGKLIEI